MKLTPVICTQCGAALSVDSDKGTRICPYCNTVFIIEKARKVFNNTYNIVNNISAQNVYIQDSNRKFEVVGGVLRKYVGSSTEVIIPNSVVKIGANTFKGTKIKSVFMSDNVLEIEQGAFEGCDNLETIVFSQAIKDIGVRTFYGCRSLKTVCLPPRVNTIRYKTFFNCSSLTKIKLPKSLMHIEAEAFSGCSSLEEIVLPQNLSVIGEGAFNDCTSLLQLHIPGKITEIGKSIFKNCENLKSVFFEDSYIDEREVIDIDFGDKDIYVGGEKVIGKYKIALKFPKSKVARECQERIERRKRNLCLYCGGAFTGFITLRCSKCGRKKDYRYVD